VKVQGDVKEEGQFSGGKKGESIKALEKKTRSKGRHEKKCKIQ